MENYGGTSRKPTWIYTSDPCFSTVRQYCTRKRKAPVGQSMTVVTTDKMGRKQVAGGKDLKATQAYPKGFGAAVANVCQVHAAHVLITGNTLHEKALAAVATSKA